MRGRCAGDARGCGLGCVGSQGRASRSWRVGGAHLGQLAFGLDARHDELGREACKLRDVARGARVVARDHPDLLALLLQLADDAGRVGLERVGDGEAARQVEAAATLVARERREHDGVPGLLEARHLRLLRRAEGEAVLVHPAAVAQQHHRAVDDALQPLPCRGHKVRRLHGGHAARLVRVRVKGEGEG